MKLLLFMFIIIASANIYGEEAKNDTPEPYLEDEFPQALKDLRRSSIVFSGSFPLMYMYSSIISDNFLKDSELYNGPKDMSEDERDSHKVEFKIISSLILAGIITIIDLVIEKFFKGS